MNNISMKKRYCRIPGKKSLAAAALLALSLPAVGSAAQAADAGQSPLLDILIQKGILTQEEAGRIQQEAAAQEQQKQQEMVKDIQDKGLAIPEALKGIKIEGLGYIDYSAGNHGAAGDKQSSYNDFTLQRGYLGVTKEITPWLGARVTTDITRLASGDIETRIKYLYAYAKPKNVGFLTDMTAEFGQGHIPWLDFEEHVNPFRLQGTMPIERAGVLNSADVGISLQGFFGGKLADAKARTGNGAYAGRYGSWHFGVYNGAGYHADDKNGNKPIEGRLTLRPLPDTLPGLQLSYFGVTGKGNQPTNEPDYSVNMGMISYEHPAFILYTDYIRTTGNSGGTWVVPGTSDSLETSDLAFFGTYHLPVLQRKLSVFGRYDHFDGDVNNDVRAGDDATYNLYMSGLVYDIYKGNMVLLDYEWANYGKDSGGMGNAPVIGNNLGNDNRVQLVYQFAF
ncbi:MAG: hypothetical protein M0017_12890 [Desulfobacteraceae bacterium]|nr:hypothetical protein [Desulfobacteraceae bacterium]